jgi:hypothetical protein
MLEFGHVHLPGGLSILVLTPVILVRCNRSLMLATQ